MRRFLVVVLLVASACGTVRAQPPARSGSSRGVSPAAVPTAAPVPWQIHDAATHHEIEGYADHVSVRAGQPVRLYVRSRTGYVVRAFRMGWYHGREARLVWTSRALPARAQPAATRDARNTVEAHWAPAVRISTAGWRPGDYLFRLDASSGKQWFVPLTVRGPTPKGAVVLVNAVATWEAYNDWGGYNLYHGPGGLPDYAHRARAVSFDRPYAEGAGSGGFLGNELPVVALAERLGLPLAYATSVDLQRDPGLLDGAAAVVSLGHDEYWSTGMRAAVTAARDRGVNVAFLGANAVFRHFRYAGTALGPDRLVVDYKDAAEDPMYGVDNAKVTVNWREPPLDDPASSLTGTTYRCNPVYADLVVADASSWLFDGVHVHDGTRLSGLVGSEYDRVDRAFPTPRPIDVVFHSPVMCRGRADHADAAYYVAGSGAGVFDAGTSSWVCAIDGVCTHGRGDGHARRVVTAVTKNLLRAFAAGPAGRRHPVAGRG